MSGSEDDGTRDRDTIERELRLLASVRMAYRERGGTLPSITQMDALLDELLELSTTLSRLIIAPITQPTAVVTR
jgi:hypothetical protein